MMQTGVPEDYLSFSMMVGQEILYHLLYLSAIWAAYDSWLCDTVRPAGTRACGQWKHYGEPTPGLPQWTRASSTLTACWLSPFQTVAMIVSQGWKRPLWLSSLISVYHPESCRLKMSSDGEHLPFQRSWFTFEYLCEKFIFYTKINSANMFHPDIILVLNLGAINDQTNLSP